MAQQLSKTLNVVDTMVLSDDHPNAPCVASSGRRKWSSRFTGFLRRQLLTNDGYGVNDQLLLVAYLFLLNKDKAGYSVYIMNIMYIYKIVP